MTLGFRYIIQHMSNEELILKLVENQNDEIKEMRKDLSEIRIDVALMKDKPGCSHNHKKANVSAATTGGSVGAILTALMAFIYEWFKGPGS